MKQRIPMASRLHGRLDDVSGEAGYPEPPPRVGFFTDTSVCIGCKACEVACKEWNALPDPEAGVLKLSGESYDNTGSLGSNSWRHVAFIEQGPLEVGAPIPADDFRPAGPRGPADVLGPALAGADGPLAPATRWLMASDVCKHCTHAACLDVCPTGALLRTEFGTVIVQSDVCNGCAYCVSACPFGVIDRREDDGRAWKCTMCYDRLRGGMSRPAPRPARPTRSSSGRWMTCGSPPRPGCRNCRTAARPARGCTGPIRTMGSAGRARSSCCSMNPRSTACRRTRW